MNVVLYMRMSTDKQDNSIESQEQVLINYANNHGMKIIDKYVDEGISGRIANKRPAFLKMIEDSEQGSFKCVIVYDSSRFARNLEESIVYKSTLKRNNVELISVTEPTIDDDTSLITDAMFGALNEMYSRKLSKSVKRGMVFSAQKGLFQTPPPHGYIKDKTITTVKEEEAIVVKKIYNLFAENQTYHSVTVKLNEMGLTTRTGKAWRACDIKRILHNPAYIGKVKYCGEVYDGQHEPIIDLELYETVQSIISAKPIRKQRPNSTYKHWLSGLIKCFHCGSAMNHVTDSNGSRSYRCSGHSTGKCKHSNFMSVPKLERLMIIALEEVLINQNMMDYSFFMPRENNTNESELLNLALQKLNTKLARCKEAYINGIDTIDEYKQNKNTLTLEQEVILNKLESLKDKNPKEQKIEKLKEETKKLIEVLASDDFTIEKKSIAIKLLVNKIILNKENGTFYVYFYL